MLVLPSKVAPLWNQFLRQNKDIVFKYIVRQIRKGILEHKKKIDLFRFEDDDQIASVPKENFLFALEDAKREFVKKELYEMAQYTQEVIDLYHIEQLILDTSKEA